MNFLLLLLVLMGRMDAYIHPTSNSMELNEEKNARVERFINLFLREYLIKMYVTVRQRKLTSIEEKNVMLAIKLYYRDMLENMINIQTP